MVMIDRELSGLRQQIGQMWELVYQQTLGAGEALTAHDRKRAEEVICRERKVNATELQIDSECEDLIARYGPVAIDLRFVLAVLKINTNLERLGDFAESIARSIILWREDTEPDHELIQLLHIGDMLEQVLGMLAGTKEALEKESSELARRVILQDSVVDKINGEALDVISAYLARHPDRTYAALVLIGIVRKLERFGDHCTNIAEEIIFYLDAKVVKHEGKKDPAKA